jgi:predicted DNA-binding transcriptional regulator YafY
MNDQAKFQRMLEILMKLSGSYGYSVKQLSEEFDSSDRTIYRYLNTFKNAGFLLIYLYLLSIYGQQFYFFFIKSIPHFGHLPALSDVTSGCMEQV